MGKNGMYPMSAYFISNFVLQIPYMLLLALFAIGVPAYAIMGYPVPNFSLALVTMAAMIWSFECFGQLLGVAFQNPLVGMLAAVGGWFSAFLFAGIFLQPEFIIWPFRVFCSVSPLRWCVRSMQYLAFHGTTWEGGRTGEEMLDVLSTNYAVEADGHVLEGISYMLLIGLFFKLCHLLVLICKLSYNSSTSLKAISRRSTE